MTPDLEELIEACVEAELALRIADREAAVLREMRRENPRLTPDQRRRLNEMEAEVTRLSWAVLAAQRPLKEANGLLFRQHLAEVIRRVESRLREPK